MTDIPADLPTAIVEHAADVIIFADRQGVIRPWNCAAEALGRYVIAAEKLHADDTRVPLLDPVSAASS